AYSATSWYQVSFTVVGDSLTCSATDPGNGHSQTVSATESYFSSGPAGLAGSAGAEFDNFTASPAAWRLSRRAPPRWARLTGPAPRAPSEAGGTSAARAESVSASTTTPLTTHVAR